MSDRRPYNQSTYECELKRRRAQHAHDRELREQGYTLFPTGPAAMVRQFEQRCDEATACLDQTENPAQRQIHMLVHDSCLAGRDAASEHVEHLAAEAAARRIIEAVDDRQGQELVQATRADDERGAGDRTVQQ